MTARVGQPAPSFKVQAYDRTKDGTDQQFRTVALEDLKGKWVCLYFYPLDFTFVCPTEIAEFGRRAPDFRARGAAVLGVSTDTHYVHLAWRRHEPLLRDLPFPMLADTKRELAGALGVLHPTEGVALRATFIVDPAGTIRHASANDLAVGRSVDETLRILDALRTGGLTPCGWKPGDPTLRAA